MAVLDLLVMGYHTVDAVRSEGAFGFFSERERPSFDRELAALSGASMALSALQGFRSTAECRRRVRMSEQAIADHVRKLAEAHRLGGGER